MRHARPWRLACPRSTAAQTGHAPGRDRGPGLRPPRRPPARRRAPRRAATPITSVSRRRSGRTRRDGAAWTGERTSGHRSDGGSDGGWCDRIRHTRRDHVPDARRARLAGATPPTPRAREVHSHSIHNVNIEKCTSSYNEILSRPRYTRCGVHPWTIIPKTAPHALPAPCSVRRPATSGSNASVSERRPSQGTSHQTNAQIPPPAPRCKEWLLLLFVTFHTASLRPNAAPKATWISMPPRSGSCSRASLALATATKELICARIGPFAVPQRSSAVRAASRTCCSCRSRRWRRPCRRRSG